MLVNTNVHLNRFQELMNLTDDQVLTPSYPKQDGICLTRSWKNPKSFYQSRILSLSHACTHARTHTHTHTDTSIYDLFHILQSLWHSCLHDIYVCVSKHSSFQKWICHTCNYKVCWRIGYLIRKLHSADHITKKKTVPFPPSAMVATLQTWDIMSACVLRQGEIIFSIFCNPVTSNLPSYIHIKFHFLICNYRVQQKELPYLRSE